VNQATPESAGSDVRPSKHPLLLSGQATKGARARPNYSEAQCPLRWDKARSDYTGLAPGVIMGSFG